MINKIIENYHLFSTIKFEYVLDSKIKNKKFEYVMISIVFTITNTVKQVTVKNLIIQLVNIS